MDTTIESRSVSGGRFARSGATPNARASRRLGGRTPGRPFAAPPFPRKVLFEALEQRQLLSADFNPGAPSISDPEAQPALFERQVPTAPPEVLLPALAGAASGAGSEPSDGTVTVLASSEQPLTPLGLDTGTLDLLRPHGALLYRADVVSNLDSPGEIDSWTIALDPGQSVSLGFALLDPSLHGELRLFNPHGDPLGTVIASGAGAPAAIGALPISVGGLHTIDVVGLAGSGGYQVNMLLNGLFEQESFGGPANDVLAAAQDLTASAVSLPGGDRLAALGRTGNDPDFYRFDLAAGQVATLALADQGGTLPVSLELELLDGGGALITLGESDADNAVSMIRDFVSPAAGTYYARVSGLADHEYALVVTRGVSLDLGSNNQAADAQDIALTGSVLGSLGRSTEGSASGSIRVAVVSSGSGEYYDAALRRTYDQLNDDTWFDFDALWVAPSEVDTLAEISTFDVVLLGGTIATTNQFDSVVPVLRAYVESGGGVVLTGFGIYGAQGLSGQARAEFDSVIPVNTGGSWNYHYEPTITPVGSHPIIEGLPSFYLGANTYAEYPGSFPQVDADATVLATANGQPTVAAKELGAGRAVYLGPTYAYYYEPAIYTAALRTGYADQLLEQAVAWAATRANDTVDQYRIQASAGDMLILTTRTPGDGPDQPDNDLDPILELYNADGVLVASNNNGAPDGRNARIEYPVVQSGEYRVRMAPVTGTGDYVLLVEGATGGAPRPLSITRSSIAPGALLNAYPDHLTLEFSTPLDLRALAAGDVTVNGIASAGVEVLGARSVRIDLTAQASGDGEYAVGIAAGALVGLQGVANDAWSLQFTVDATPPSILDHTLAGGARPEAGDFVFRAVLTEALAPELLAIEDVLLVEQFSGQAITAQWLQTDLDGNLEIGFGELRDGRYHLTLTSATDAFRDRAGNLLDGDADGQAGGDFFVDFGVDSAFIPYPTPLEPKLPAGSLIYDPTVRGTLYEPWGDDYDTYTLELDAGQLLSVKLTPVDAQLRARIAVFDPSGSFVAVAEAGAAGESVILANLPAGTGGTYEIVLSNLELNPGSGDWTSGRFDLAVLLNAAYEDEAAGGAQNNELGHAQDLSATFIDLGGGALHAAVLGNLERPSGSTLLGTVGRGGTLSTLVEIDPENGAVLRTIGPVGYVINGLEYDTSSGILYGTVSATDANAPNRLLTIDLSTGAGTPYAMPAGVGTLVNLTTDSNGQMYAWTESGDDLVRMNPATGLGVVVGNFGFGTSTHSLAFDESDILWFFNGNGNVYTVSTATGAGSFQFNLEATAHHGDFDPDTGYLYAVGNTNPTTPLVIIDVQARQVLGYFETGVQLHTLTFMPGSGGVAEPEDWYRFELDAGERVSLALRHYLSGYRDDIRLELFDGAGNRLALGMPDGGNVDQLVAGFVPATGGTYYARVFGRAPGDYSLVLTRNLDFGIETAAPQELLSSAVLGAIEGGDTDTYLIRAAEGDTLTIFTATPGGGAGEPVNELDPRIDLYDAFGGLVASDHDSRDGRNASLSVTVGAGEYLVVVSSQDGTSGEYLLTVNGATGARPDFVVTHVDPADGSALPAFPESITLDFSAPLRLDSLALSDFTVVDPWGNPVLPDWLRIEDHDTVVIGVGSADAGEGAYELHVGAGVVSDLSGRPVQALVSTFYVDVTPPVVTATSVIAGEVVPVGDIVIDVTFSEAMQAAVLDAGDVVLRNDTSAVLYAVQSIGYDPGGFTVSLGFSGLREGSYTLTLLSALEAFRDLPGTLLDGDSDGVPGGDFVLQFIADLDAADYPEPLLAKLPTGSLIFDPAAAGLFHAEGDEDRYTFDLDAGQTLSLLLTTADPGLRTYAAVLNGAGTVLGAAGASAAGEPLVLQTVPVAAAGTYTILVRAETGTGGYQLQPVLNAAIGPLSGSGAAASLSDAQNLDGSFIAIGTAASRGAVRGVMDADPDWYRFNVNAGEATTLTLTRDDHILAPAVGLALYDAAGNLLATGSPGALNVDRYIADFVPLASGTFHARVTGANPGEYSLVITRGAAFDLERATTVGDAQDLTLSGVALGGLGGLGSGSLGTGPSGSASMPQNRFDASGYRWDIQGNGTIGDGIADAYDGGMQHTGFGSFATAQTEDGGREIVLGPQSIGGVEVVRKIYVPADQSYARFLEVVRNPSATQTVTYTVPIFTNLGSDGNEPYVMTSSGDAVTTTADNWLITDDSPAGVSSGTAASPTSDPVVTHVVAGDGGRLRPATFVKGSGVVNYSYNLTLAPGETQIVMHFAGQAGNQPTAVSRAEQLARLELDALSGMSAAERAAVVNFNVGDQLDVYTVLVNAGDALVITTGTPFDGSGAPANELLDARLSLFRPDGTLVASNDNGAGDGRNARIEYTVPTGGAGKYRIEVQGLTSAAGSYVLQVAGTTAAPTAFSVVGTNPSDGALLASFPAVYRIDVSEPLLLTSVDAADLTVDGVAADAVVVIDADTLEFNIAGRFAGDGVYNVAIAAGALTSLSGKPLQAFGASFDSDLTNPTVSASSVTPGQSVEPGLTILSFQFSEELASSGLDGGDVILLNTTTGSFVTATAFAYDPGTSLASVQYAALAEGDYTLTLRSAADGFRDRRGNLLDGDADGVGGDDFLLQFRVDNTLRALPPLQLVRPAGALIYDPPVAGLFDITGDVDQFTLTLDAGQSLSVVLATADLSLRSRIEVIDPASQLVASVEASAAGSAALLQSLPVTTAGTYTLRLTALEGSGHYTVQAVLNAALEAETWLGTGNDSLAAAQGIDTSAIPLPGAATRLAVLGVAGDDYYAVTFSAGEVASIVATRTDRQAAAGLTLTLFDTGGTILAHGIGTVSSVDQAISSFVAPASGTYYLRVTGSGQAYSLVVTRGSEFDLETGGAQFIGTSGRVLGALGSFGASGTTSGARVAVVSSGGGAAQDLGLVAIVNQLNDDTWFDFDATLVPMAAVDTLPEITAYDVVLIGGSGYSSNQFAAIAPVLRAYVEGGGGLVTTGWGIYAAGGLSGQTRADFDAIVPVNVSGSYDYFSQVTVVTVGTHPVVDGVGSFVVASYVEYPWSAPRVDPGATLLASVSSAPVAAAGEFGLGRSVYLGPIYAGGSGYGTNDLREGAADRLLEQAVAWVSSDVRDSFSIAVTEGQTLDIRTHTPGDGAGDPNNTLDARLELYNHLGFLVATNDNGAADGRNARIVYPVPAGSSGTYEVRVGRVGSGSGEYVLTVDGIDANLGAPPSVIASTPADGSNVAVAPAHITLTFSEALRADSVGVEDLTLDGGASVTGVQLLDGRTVRFAVSVPDVEATYGYTLAAGAVSDLQGQANLGHSASFQIDRTGPVVVAQSPALQASTSFANIVFTFNEPLDPASVSTADVASFTGPGGANLLAQITGVSAVGNTLTVSFNPRTAQGTYTMVIGPAIRDSVGNAMATSYTATVDLASPDLSATALAFSVPGGGPASFGRDLLVNWTVTNIGSDPALEDWFDRIWISPDAVLGNGNDTVLATVSAAARSPLANGAHYDASATVTLPLSTALNAGTYYLFVQTDATARQMESNESNNTRFEAISVVLPPLPDLVVSNIVAPIETLSGQSVSLSWTLVNQGNGAASGTWTDYLYLSPDATAGDGNDVYYGAFSFSGELNSNASVTRTQDVTLAPTLQGNYWVVVRTDVHNQIYEHTNEGNNIAAAATPMNVVLQPFPNLRVTAITPPTEAFSSQDTVISWVVSNIGTGPTSAPIWWDAVYLSLDDVIDDGDTFLGTVANPSFLGSGDSYSSSLQATLPRGIDGNYRYIVRTDYYNQVLEFGNENDNVSASALSRVRLTAPPDLQVTNVNAPLSAFSGQPMSLGYTVTNLGTGRTLESAWHDRIVMSQDDELGNDDDRILVNALFHVGALDPGEFYTVNTTVQLPIGVYSVDEQSPFHFFVVTDVFNGVYEHSWESNNSARDSVPTRILLTPPPDLEVVSLSVPAAAESGRTLMVGYRVENLGADATPAVQSSWYDTVYLSADDVLDAADLKLGDVGHAGVMQPGDGYDRNVGFTLPNTLTGSYFVIVHADRTNTLFEDEAGNPAAAQNNLRVSAAPVSIVSRPADLRFTAVSVQAQAEAGLPMRVEWTVGNFGAGDTIVTSWTDRVILSVDPVLGNGDDRVLADFGRSGLFAPEATYTRTEFITLPFDLLGSYHVIVVTDVHDRVYEGSADAGNVSPAQPIQISRRPPDLQVISIEPAASVFAGERLVVTFSVRNAGSNQTNVNFWDDAVYLSHDANPGNDVLLGNVRRSNPLPADAQYTATASLTVPRDLPAGDYWVVVVTDVGNRVLETPFEDNNAAVSLTAVTVAIDPSIPIPPELLHPDLELVTVDAPAEGTTGQNIEVSWEVRNAGADPTGNRAWFDFVYLSRDQVFDRNSDTLLGYVGRSGGLDAGGVYTGSGSFKLPNGLAGPFYVFVAVDARNDISNETNENNNRGFDPNLIQVALAPPVDLVAGTITVPDNAVPGASAQVTYTVRNESTNSAFGSWTDSLYLSTDPHWDVNDTLFARVVHGGGLAANSSYTKTVNGLLPGVTPGGYHVIVRSDIFNAIPESNEANNIAASIDQVAVDVPALTLGTPTGGNLGPRQALFYKFEVGDGETVLLAVDAAVADGDIELYVRRGSMPTRGQFDVSSREAFTPDPQMLIPDTITGTYYVMVYGAGLAGSTAFEIQAQVLPFSVRGLQPAIVGNLGDTTIEIQGAKFNAGTLFELVDAAGNTLVPINVVVQNSSQAFVTFSLAGEVAGSRDLRATSSAGEVIQLQDAVSVLDGFGASILSHITGPSQVRPNRLYSFTLEYSNGGGNDVVAPLFFIQSSTNTPFGPTLQSLGASNVVQLLGVSLDGPQDILRPGDPNTIQLLFRSDTNPIRFQTRTVSATNTSAIDFDLVERSLRTPGLSDAQWADRWNRLLPRIGQTWAEYATLINHLSKTYSEPGQPISDVRALIDRLFTEDPTFQATSTVAGFLRHADTGLGLSAVNIGAYLVTGDGLRLFGRAVTAADGSFRITGLPKGDYRFVISSTTDTLDGEVISATTLVFDMDQDGAPDAANPTVKLTGEADVQALVLYAREQQPQAPVTQDQAPALAVDGAGRAHLVWIHEGQLWHAVNEGGGWINAQPIPGATGSAARVVTDALLIDGTTEGLLVAWTGGQGNESEIYYSVGQRNADGSYAWTAPVRLTDNAVFDGEYAVGVGAGGDPVFVWQKRDFAIDDDSDLYTSQISIDLPQFLAELALSFDDIADILGAMSDEELEAAGIHRIRFGRDIGRVTIPSWVPVLGGTYEAQFRVDGQAQIDCTLVYALNGALRLKVGSSGEIEGRVGGDVRYVVNRDDCVYEFNRGRIRLQAVGALNFPLTFLPFVGAALTAAGVKGRIEAGLAGNLNWGPGDDFPGLPGSASGSLRISLGANWEQEVSVWLLGSGKVTGRILGNARFTLDADGLGLGQPPFSISALIRGEFTLFGRKTMLDWTGTWPGGTVDTSSMSLLGLSEMFSLDAPLFDETYTLTVTDEVATGTLNDYSTSTEFAITSNLVDEGSPVIAENAAGELLLACTTQNGVTLRSWDAAAAAWVGETLIPDSGGFTIRSLAVSFDGDGDVIAVWNRLDTSALNPSSTTEEILAVLQAGGDLAYAHYEADTGTWSAVQTLAPGAGMEHGISLYRASNGGIVMAYLTRTSDSQATLRAALWDAQADAFGVSSQLAAGRITDLPAAAEIVGTPIVMWAEAVGADPTAMTASTALYMASWNGTEWSTDPFAFSLDPAVLATLVAQAQAEAAQAALYAEGIPLPAVPEDCCDDEEDEEDEEEEDDDDDDDDDYEPPVVVPRDPNDIIGPAGFGPENWIAAGQTLPYMIRFENASDAQAPAQQVVITQQLDADLDFRTFRVDDFGWGDLRIELPADRAFYSNRIDLTATHGFFVDVQASINTTTGVATWTITTIDPATGEQPLDAQAGFLPTNDEAGRGEGFVSYTIRPRGTVGTGAVIDAEARIVFDTEGPIDTPPIFNTLDAGVPTSTVHPLPELSTLPEFEVTWSGVDDEGGSAIATYSIFVSTNGGAFALWLANTEATAAVFTGTSGNTYAFYSIARDNAGNTEAAPDAADASTVVLVATEPAALRGSKFHDLDGDGIQDEGETGLGGWTIFLDADDDGVLDAAELSVTTEADGSYGFNSLPPGTYIVREVLQEGWLRTAPSSGRIEVTVSEGEVVNGLDFGNFRLVTLSGVKFNDRDGDGLRGAEEEGLAGWTIYLDADQDGVRDAGELAVLTDAQGNYMFAGVGPGSHMLREIMRSGWVATTPEEGFHLVTTSSGSDLGNLDFGNRELPRDASIAGVKFDDLNGNGLRDEGEPGLEHWLIFLDADGDGLFDPETERSTLTDAQGAYRFDEVAPGTYTVVEVLQPGWMQTYPGAGPGSIGAASLLTTLSSAAALETPEVVLLDQLLSLGLEDILRADALSGVSAFRADPRFAGIDGGGLSVAIIDTGIDWDHPFFGIDADGDGVSDRIVFQYDFADLDPNAQDLIGHGSGIASIIGSEDSRYAGLAPGADLVALKVFSDSGRGYFLYAERALQWVAAYGAEYGVAVVNLSLGDGANWNQAISRYGLGDELAALARQGIIVVAAAGNNYSQFNYAGVAYPAADPNAIGVGAVWSGDYGGPWRFSNGAIDYTTDADRVASFSQRDPLLTEIFAPGARLTGANAAGGISTTQGTSQATAYVSGLALLAQDLALDVLGRRLTPAEFLGLLTVNADIIVDGDDENDNVHNTGMSFLRVDMLALAEGILGLQAAGSGSDTQSGGGGSSTDHTPVRTAAVGHTVVVAAGENLTGVNFGNFRLAELSGVKFEDRDGDGSLGADESGLSGWTIYLDLDDNGVLDEGEVSVVTGADGGYRFIDLGPGSYTVREVVRSGWVLTGPEDGAYTVSVSSGLVASGLDFGNRNLPPIALDDAYRIAAGGVLVVGAPGVLDNDFDTEPLALALVSGPSHGELSLKVDGNDAGGFVYTPATGYTGLDEFTYSVTDPYGNSAQATVRLEVRATNQPPTARDDDYAGDEDQAIAGNVLDNDDDPNTDTLTAHLVMGPQYGTLSLNPDGTFEYKPAEDWHGIDSFTYVARDGLAESDPARVTLTVRPVNDLPTAVSPGDQTLREGESLVFTVNANDVDGDELSFSLLFGPGSVDPLTGEYSFMAQDGAALHDVGIRVSDGHSVDSFFDVLFQISIANVAPTLTISGATVTTQDVLYVLSLASSDPGDDTIIGWTIAWGDGNVAHVSGNPSEAQHTYAVPGSYIVSATATDEDGTWEANVLGVEVVAAPLRVLSLTPTESGFDVRFNRALDPTTLNLYDTSTAGFGPADVVLRGAANGLVRGSMDVDATAGLIRFVRTGAALAADTYTVTLRSAPNGFVDVSGALLDGDNDGTPGGDHVATFTVSSASGRTLSIPDFVRGPGQTVDVPASAAGLPITLSDGSGISSVAFDLQYDPALLRIEEVLPGAGLPSGAALHVSGSAGHLHIEISGALPAGSVQLVKLAASIPDDAPYFEKHVLDLSGVLLNGGAIAGRADDGLAVVAYFGDTNGNAEISTVDSTTLSNVVVGRDSGLQFYRNVDPIIIGDVSGDGKLTSLDSARILQEATWILTGNATYNRPEIPELPAGIEPIVLGGPDPLVNVPAVIGAEAGSKVLVPVNLDIADGMETAQFTLAYDTSLLRLDAVRRGTLTQGYEVFIYHDAGGRVSVDTSTQQALRSGAGSIAMLEFTALAAGTAHLDLETVRLNGGNLVLSPEPLPGYDPTDGSVRISSAEATAVVAPANESTVPPIVPLRAVSVAIPPSDAPMIDPVTPSFPAAGETTPAPLSTAPAMMATVDWNGRVEAESSTAGKTTAPERAKSPAWVKSFVNDLGRKTAVSPNASLRVTLPTARL